MGPERPRRLRRPEASHAPRDLEAALEQFLASAAPAAPAAAEPPAAGDWKSALLDEYGVSRPGQGGAFEPVHTPPSAPPGWVPPAIDWSSVPAREVPIAPGERVPVYPVPPAGEPPALLRGLKPGAVPGSLPVYQALLRQVYGPPTHALAAAIEREPLFAYALQRWRPMVPGTLGWAERGSREGNLALLDAVYDRLCKLMAAYYDFDPAPLAYLPQMDPGALGLYFPARRILCVSSRSLGGPLYDVVDTIVHEQTHAYQFQTLARYWAGERFGGYQDNIVALWAQQEPTRGRGANLHLGIEIHAYAVGGRAGEAIRAIGGR